MRRLKSHRPLNFVLVPDQPALHPTHPSISGNLLGVKVKHTTNLREPNLTPALQCYERVVIVFLVNSGQAKEIIGGRD